MDKKIVVIGAVNVDICGTSAEQLILYDSNPGGSMFSYGGVGRNIAENLCRLGCKVDMITMLGDDVFSKELVAYSEKVGISFEHSFVKPGAQCSKYISINNYNGDMILAVSDMQIFDDFPVEHIMSKLDVLNSADLVILDTNLPQNVIDYVAFNCTAPMAIDPVSTVKALKARNVLGKFTVMKPNNYEAEVLSGIKIENDLDLKASADFFLGLGIKKIFISLGEDGVYYSDGITYGKKPSRTDYDILNVSGCGDAFVSAACWAMLMDKSIEEMADIGLCASNICAGSEGTISTELCADHINRLLNK